jgi:hypothetical protein
MVGKMVLRKRWARNKNGACEKNKFSGRTWVGHKMVPWIKCVLKDGWWQGNDFEEKVGKDGVKEKMWFEEKMLPWVKMGLRKRRFL